MGKPPGGTEAGNDYGEGEAAIGSKTERAEPGDDLTGRIERGGCSQVVGFCAHSPVQVCHGHVAGDIQVLAGRYSGTRRRETKPAHRLLTAKPGKIRPKATLAHRHRCFWVNCTRSSMWLFYDYVTG